MGRHKYTYPPVMSPIASDPVTNISTPSLLDSYREAQNWAKSFNNKLDEIRRVEKAIDRADSRTSWWKRLEWLGGWAQKRAEHWKEEACRLDNLHSDMEKEAESIRPHTLFNIGDEASPTWVKVVDAFENLCTSEKIWDVTAHGRTDHYKSSASHAVQRDEVRFGISSLPTVRPDIRSLHIVNANGHDLWIYPRVIAVCNFYTPPALIDLEEVQISCIPKNFIEDEKLPGDAQQVGFTWRYINKDGGPDRRFSDNPQLPVLLYGEIDLKSSGGLFERFQVSDIEKARQFERCLTEHKAAIRIG